MMSNRSSRALASGLALSVAAMSFSPAAMAVTPLPAPAAPLAPTVAYQFHLPAAEFSRQVAPATDLEFLAGAAGLPAGEADEAQAGMPWWVVTGLISSGGAIGAYLLDVYVWKKTSFNWYEFTRRGGCGALGGVVWGLGGGWAGRVAIKYAFISAGAVGVVNVCNNVF